MNANNNEVIIFCIIILFKISFILIRTNSILKCNREKLIINYFSNSTLSAITTMSSNFNVGELLTTKKIRLGISKLSLFDLVYLQ